MVATNSCFATKPIKLAKASQKKDMRKRYLLKWDSMPCVFLWILQNFFEKLFKAKTRRHTFDFTCAYFIEYLY